MSDVNWILGPSIDTESSDQYDDEAFIGYLVHLNNPRCVLLVCRDNFVQNNSIELNSTTGYYHRDSKKGIEMVIIEWLDDPPTNPDDISRVLQSAAVHIEIHLLNLIEQATLGSDDEGEDEDGDDLEFLIEDFEEVDEGAQAHGQDGLADGRE